tara:strand:- start:161 stop:1864 length:1704 start_codon:yes stop_codon:yes gene_type:complete
VFPQGKNMNTRILTIETERADSESRIAPAVLSTETPVFRSNLGANEILKHTSDSVDLTRSPLPLIESHDSSKTPIGIVENIRVENGKLRGQVRLGDSGRAKELWNDIKSGILRSLSIGYEILSGDYLNGDYVVDRFRPYEASLVSVPADINAGLFRSQENSGNKMNENKENKDAIKEERSRVSEIRALGLRHSEEVLADDAITSGISLEAFRSQLLDQMERSKPLATPTIKNYGDANREFSISSALAGLDDVSKRGYEYEVSQDLERVQGKVNPDSVIIPMDRSERTLTAATAGASTIETAVDPRIRDFIQAKSIAMNLGMQEMNGLSGDLQIPVATSASGTTIMATEGTTQAAETTPTIGNKTLTPSYIGDVIPVGYKFLQQSSVDTEQYLRRLIGETFASKIDQQIIAGTGSSGQLEGFLVNSSVGSHTYTTLAFSDLISGLETLGAANVEIANLKWVINPANISDLVTAVKYSSTASPLMDIQSETDNVIGRTLGYPTLSSTNMTSGKYLLGDFSQAVMATFGGGLEISRNPFYDDRRFTQSYNALMGVGFAIVQPTCFVKLTT